MHRQQAKSALDGTYSPAEFKALPHLYYFYILALQSGKNLFHRFGLDFFLHGANPQHNLRLLLLRLNISIASYQRVLFSVSRLLLDA